MQPAHEPSVPDPGRRPNALGSEPPGRVARSTAPPQRFLGLGRLVCGGIRPRSRPGAGHWSVPYRPASSRFTAASIAVSIAVAVSAASPGCDCGDDQVALQIHRVLCLGGHPRRAVPHPSDASGRIVRLVPVVVQDRCSRPFLVGSREKKGCTETRC